MLRVVYISEALSGGVRRHLVDLLSFINVKEFELHVIYGTQRVDSVFKNTLITLENRGVKFYPVKELTREVRLKQDIVAFKKISEIIREIKPDIVHCHSSKGGAIGRVVAKYLRIQKIYYTPHAYVFQDPNISRKKILLYKFVEKFLGIITTNTIHVSNGEERMAIRNKVINPTKSLVIKNAIPVQISKNDQNKLKSRMVVGTVARMDHQKNPWLFIKIAEKVIKTLPDVEFRYVGDGQYYDEILSYIRDRSLSSNIKLLGFVSEPESELDEFDIFLSTSLYEGLPYSLIEALALKKPIIATDVVGNNEVVNNGYNGFLFNIHDVNQGADRIIDVISNQEILNELSRNSFKLFQENFSIDKMIASVEKLYISK